VNCDPHRLPLFTVSGARSQQSSDLAAAVNVTGAVNDWDRAVRALETPTGGGSGGPLDSSNTAAAQQRTSVAVARARGTQLPREVVDAVEYKPLAYSVAVRAASVAGDASSDLAAEMARAQLFLDYLAIV
jgi:hypothetical protein